MKFSTKAFVRRYLNIKKAQSVGAAKSALSVGNATGGGGQGGSPGGGGDIPDPGGGPVTLPKFIVSHSILGSIPADPTNNPTWEL